MRRVRRRFNICERDVVSSDIVHTNLAFYIKFQLKFLVCENGPRNDLSLN